MNSNTTPFKKVASKKSLSRKASNPNLPLADGYASTAFENVECMLDKIFSKARGQAFCVKQDKQDTPESFRKQTIEQPPQLLREDEPLYEDCMTPTSAINSNKIYMAPSYSALRDSENIGTSYVSNAPTSANTALSMNSQKSSCTSGVTALSIKSHNSLTQTSP
uniref:Uncharacterized protein n=1 Tax=Rhabditophanes sp. KR3021 TaxID=114890 RepID=A0AC35UAA6_9BILA